MATSRKQRGETQGKEFTITVQAPTMEELEFMEHDLRDYADEHGLEQFEVLQKGPDPDGGYRAIIVAHNWNPLAWLSEKYQARAGGPEARAAVAKERAATTQAVRIARERAARPEKVKTAEEIAAGLERRKRARLLRESQIAKGMTPEPVVAAEPKDLTKFIFS